jgi:glycerol-3-phosphate acyltransferase PlsY
MTPQQLTAYLLLPLAAYLLGSIPFAFVIGKAKGTDIRTVGSKNIGATNLGRTFGKKYFFYAFFLDALKGTLPVLAAALYVQHHNAFLTPFLTTTSPDNTLYSLGRPDPLPAWTPLLTAVAAVLGHNFPLFLKFKGGKGVATSFGAVLGFWPLYTLSGLVAISAFIFTFMVYRFISLASMTGACAFFAAVLLLGSNPRFHLTYLHPRDLAPLLVVAALFALLIIIRHRANIRRLLNGTEPAWGQRKPNAPAAPPPVDPE